MKIIMLTLLAPACFAAHSNENEWTIFPETKYSPGHCIVSVSPDSSWLAKYAKYAKYAKLYDVVYSKKYKKFTYILRFNDSNVNTLSFEIDYVDSTTQKAALGKCKY